MKITEVEVRYIADLANLALTDGEIHKFSHDLDEILAHMDTLNELDLTGIEPMAQVLYQAEDTATLRADQVQPTLGAKAALANAAVSGAGYYKVPRVIER